MSELQIGQIGRAVEVDPTSLSEFSSLSGFSSEAGAGWYQLGERHAFFEPTEGGGRVSVWDSDPRDVMAAMMNMQTCSRRVPMGMAEHWSAIATAAAAIAAADGLSATFPASPPGHALAYCEVGPQVSHYHVGDWLVSQVELPDADAEEIVRNAPATGPRGIVRYPDGLFVVERDREKAGGE